jgi:hypothetical protein
MAKNTTPINYRIKHEKAKNLRAKLMAWRKTKIDTLDTLDPSEPSILDALSTYRNTNCSTIDNYNSVETMAFDGRLRELFEPLYLCLFASKGSKESRLSILQKNLIGHLDDLLRQREIEEESGLDAEILRIIIGCNHTDGRFGTKQVADVFNSCRREKSQWKTATIGHMISRLGFQRCRMNDGRRGYQYDEKLVERLKKRYKIGDVNG